MSLRDNWKEAGSGIGHAFKGLGKAFAETAKNGVRKVNDWANGDEEASAAPAAEPVVVEAELVTEEQAPCASEGAAPAAAEPITEEKEA